MHSRKQCPWVHAFTPLPFHGASPVQAGTMSHAQTMHFPRTYTKRGCAGRQRGSLFRQTAGDGHRVRWVSAITAERPGLLRGVVCPHIGDRNLCPQSRTSPARRDATRLSCRHWKHLQARFCRLRRRSHATAKKSASFGLFSPSVSDAIYYCSRLFLSS